uniref:Putative ribonuclease H-like domain-containing protein n=1 Tax=Tanacetum cinerariifolium TaxID=118510 RepID=A0A6L2LUP5_TANCI|nr:putative ribonuclease H-like domain-containing protein [Tanacetum cinerariifolium]
MGTTRHDRVFMAHPKHQTGVSRQSYQIFPLQKNCGMPWGRNNVTLSWLRYTLEESCPNQNTTSAGAQEQSSPNISSTEDTVPNLISEVSNSQPSDSLDEISENIHETVGVQEHEEPTLTEVPKKYVLPASKSRLASSPVRCEECIPTRRIKRKKYIWRPRLDSLSISNIEKSKKYILDLLAYTGMINCKPADTPMITNQKLFMKTKAKLANRDRYQRMVGKLIYLSHTRPDIAYVVGVVSRLKHQPQVDHMHAVLRIVRYLKGTTSHGVLFKTNGHLNIQIFTDVDVDWAGDKENRRSTSRYFSLVGGNLVTWKSKKQKAVSLSSTEAKFRGIAKGLAEALWIRKLVSEIGFPPKESIGIMSDNKASIQISENPVQRDRTKHVEVDRHFIKEKLEAGIIKLPFFKSEDELAEILTKAVGMVILHKCLNKLNFGDPTVQLEGEC